MSNETFDLPPTNSGRAAARPFHRQWLMRQSDRLFDFFERSSINRDGGFHDLDSVGHPVNRDNPLRQIHATGRMVHCFAIGSLLGRPGSDEIVDHGMRYLIEHHRDKTHGGYIWSLDNNGPRDDSKQAYGHAFVLLAGSSAKLAGHPLADRLIADVSEVIDKRFWEEEHGAISEEYANDWSKITDYRGQNSNMHMTEALMAAYEATGEKLYLQRAERIAKLIIGKHALELDYRVAEHFDADWTLDKDYTGNEMFRPSGSTPGHWLEWSRLLMQLWVLGHKAEPWLPDAARGLFRKAIELGWDDKHGGFYYTLDWNNQPIMREKLWWPVCEAIAAAAFFTHYDQDPFFEIWYRRLWDFAANHLIDHENSGWRPELQEDLTPVERLFVGKPDIYHALQACLIPLFPATGSVTHAIIESNRPAHR
ncbi:mannose-6-phosphate isomerase [Devosia pacifica]|uniref:Mannose-6-phosphate isomerase n=1 Tax=Devosia pacifica TaxID=1335967 RepID=A0A918SC75_9HYPH|nr:AGE family epimerase/isomerase [Devosia pacifica]GHA34389.1 mannose-6-phosphate isomerase [Devosia pacifica]